MKTAARLLSVMLQQFIDIKQQGADVLMRCDHVTLCSCTTDCSECQWDTRMSRTSVGVDGCADQQSDFDVAVVGVCGATGGRDMSVWGTLLLSNCSMRSWHALRVGYKQRTNSQYVRRSSIVDQLLLTLTNHSWLHCIAPASYYTAYVDHSPFNTGLHAAGSIDFTLCILY